MFLIKKNTKKQPENYSKLMKPQQKSPSPRAAEEKNSARTAQENEFLEQQKQQMLLLQEHSRKWPKCNRK